MSSTATTDLWQSEGLSPTESHAHLTADSLTKPRNLEIDISICWHAQRLDALAIWCEKLVAIFKSSASTGATTGGAGNFYCPCAGHVFVPIASWQAKCVKWAVTDVASNKELLCTEGNECRTGFPRSVDEEVGRREPTAPSLKGVLHLRNVHKKMFIQAHGIKSNE